MRTLPQLGVFNQHDALAYLSQPSSVVRTGLWVSSNEAEAAHSYHYCRNTCSSSSYELLTNSEDEGLSIPDMTQTIFFCILLETMNPVAQPDDKIP